MQFKLIIPIIALLCSCQPQASGLENYNPAPPLWRNKIANTPASNTTPNPQPATTSTPQITPTFRIIQVGDSHTAGGFFTDRLRQRLQQQWGDGGIGWIYPQPISGQRNGNVRYQSSNWSGISSRSTQDDFPFGGIIARASNAGEIVINTPSHTSSIQNISLMAKPDASMQPLIVNGMPIQAMQNNWQTLQLQSSLPLTIQNSSPWTLSFINIENPQGGVTVSAMGINGAQLSQWSKWRTSWLDDLATLRPDLLILAYGTNEAFNDRIDIAQTEQKWRQTIRSIKAQLPNTSILIFGAPESLKSTAGDCGTRPIRLTEVQAMQQRIAQEEQLSYWSWQSAMGGECSMKNWVTQGLAAKDGVHFTSKGYQRLADLFADNLIEWSKAQNAR